MCLKHILTHHCNWIKNGFHIVTRNRSGHVLLYVYVYVYIDDFMICICRCITNCKSKVTPSLPLRLTVECPICQIEHSFILWNIEKENLSTGKKDFITLEGIDNDGM